VEIPEGYTTAAVVQRGVVQLSGSDPLRAVDLALLTRSGNRLAISVEEDATLLVLAGEPINEPVVGQGPFVMNTREQIVEAIRDYQAGRMGQLASSA
jgi:quercetin 2,3-dioxygenase